MNSQSQTHSQLQQFPVALTFSSLLFREYQVSFPNGHQVKLLIACTDCQLDEEQIHLGKEVFAIVRISQLHGWLQMLAINKHMQQLQASNSHSSSSSSSFLAPFDGIINQGGQDSYGVTLLEAAGKLTENAFRKNVTIIK